MGRKTDDGSATTGTVLRGQASSRWERMPRGCPRRPARISYKAFRFSRRILVSNAGLAGSRKVALNADTAQMNVAWNSVQPKRCIIHRLTVKTHAEIQDKQQLFTGTYTARQKIVTQTQKTALK
ncbi:hypothetical protein APED_21970 [Acanthopleuribacter pedis]